MKLFFLFSVDAPEGAAGLFFQNGRSRLIKLGKTVMKKLMISAAAVALFTAPIGVTVLTSSASATHYWNYPTGKMGYDKQDKKDYSRDYDKGSNKSNTG